MSDTQSAPKSRSQIRIEIAPHRGGGILLDTQSAPKLRSKFIPKSRPTRGRAACQTLKALPNRAPSSPRNRAAPGASILSDTQSAPKSRPKFVPKSRPTGGRASYRTPKALPNRAPNSHQGGCSLSDTKTPKRAKTSQSSTKQPKAGQNSSKQPTTAQSSTNRPKARGKPTQKASAQKLSNKNEHKSIQLWAWPTGRPALPAQKTWTERPTDQPTERSTARRVTERI